MYKIEIVQKERKMHEHTELNHAHVLLYCKTCDVVYCESCKKEWRRQAIWYSRYTYPYINTCNDHYTNDTTAGDMKITFT